MNYALAKEIYGMQPWCIDHQTYPILMGMVRDFQNGVTFEANNEKHNALSIYTLDNDTKIVSRPYGSLYDPGDLDSSENFTAIGVVKINGPITVSGGASSYGMDYVSNQMKRMSQDDRVKSFIILSDSGGGSSAAVEMMTDTISEIKESKPVYGLISKGGIAASAMYGILSACTSIYAESEMSTVGSVGTMIQFQGREANTQDTEGIKHVRLYASASTHKNKFYEDAVNKDNYDVILNEMLDPINERFLNLVISNRPQLKGSDYENGHTVFAKDGVGTFIDGIMSFDALVDQISQEIENKTDRSLNSSNNQNNVSMTISDLQQNHPEVYQSVFNAGLEAERSRVGVWMAHFDTDSEAVREGINSNEALTNVQREQLLVVQNAQNNLKSLEQESPKKVLTKEDQHKETSNDEEVRAFYSKWDNQ